MIRSLAALAACFLLAFPALAVQPDEILPDPALEERARDISKDLRCVVCQNENIDSSQAGMARDLRILVRERLVEGDSNEEVLDFVVERYGDYVLFNPPFKPSTYALWIGPFAVMALGLLGVVLLLTRRPRKIDAGTVALSEEEERAVAAMLAEDGKEGPKK